MLMEMGLISFNAVEMAVPICSRASSIFLTDAFLWPPGRGHGMVLCMSSGGRKEELASCSTTTAGKSMPRHAGSQRNVPLSRTRPSPHSRHGTVSPPCHKGRYLSFAAAPCTHRRVPGRLLRSVLPPMVEGGEGPRRRRRRPSPLRPVPPPLLDGGEGPRRPST